MWVVHEIDGTYHGRYFDKHDALIAAGFNYVVSSEEAYRERFLSKKPISFYGKLYSYKNHP
jgi:hypothetical protein